MPRPHGRSEPNGARASLRLSAATRAGGQEADADKPELDPSAFESRAAFLLHLRERGVRDLRVLRAMEAVPRSAFVAERYRHLGFKNIALPAPRGQSVPEPLIVARLLAGSRLDAAKRVLLVGLGVGYTTAVLSHLVDHVVAIDRLPSLVATASERLAALGRHNVELRCGDGLEALNDDVFDRILLVGAIARPTAAIWAQLAPDGVVVHARDDATSAGGSAQVLVRVEQQAHGIGRQAILGPSRLPQLRTAVIGP